MTTNVMMRVTMMSSAKSRANDPKGLMKKDSRRDWDATRFDSVCSDDLRPFVNLIALGICFDGITPKGLSKTRASYGWPQQKSTRCLKPPANRLNQSFDHSLIP